MIYRFTFFLVLGFSSAVAQSDNLVENPGFEERIDCIYNSGDVSQAPPWFSPTGATPDVFHECANQLDDPCPYPAQVYLDPWFFGVPTNTLGCQSPRSGVGYAGLFFQGPYISGNDIDWREYLGIPLSEPLVAGETYYVRFFVSLSERSRYAVYAHQVLFTAEPISESPFFWGVLNYTPQLTGVEGNFVTDKENWTELSWEYTADGTEQYMYIGNFQSNSETDTLFAVPDSIDPEDHGSSYYYIDDVYLGTELLSVMNEVDLNGLILWPNPVGQKLSVESEQTIETLSIYSILGNMIQTYTLNESGTVEVDVQSLASGSYLLLVTDQKGFKAARHFVKR